MEIESLFIQKKEYDTMKEDFTILLKRRSFQIFFSFTQNSSSCDSHDTDIRFSYPLSSSQIPVGNTHWIFSSVSESVTYILCIGSLLHYLYIFHWNTVPWQREKKVKTRRNNSRKWESREKERSSFKEEKPDCQDFLTVTRKQTNSNSDLIS